jgi:hypothetical protein
VGGAGLRSLPAKQHAPKARPCIRHAPRPAAAGIQAAVQQRAGLGGWFSVAAEGGTTQPPSPAVRPSAQSQSSSTVMYQPGRSAGAMVKCAWPWPLRCDATGKSWVNAQV